MRTILTPPPAKRSGVYWHDEWPRFSARRAPDQRGSDRAERGLRRELRRSALEDASSSRSHFLDGGTRASPHGRRRPTLRRLPADEQHRLPHARLRALRRRRTLAASLVINRNPDVALQLALIDFEVFTLAGMTQILASRVIGRERPPRRWRLRATRRLSRRRVPQLPQRSRHGGLHRSRAHVRAPPDAAPLRRRRARYATRLDPCGTLARGNAPHVVETDGMLSVYSACTGSSCWSC